MLLVAIPYRIYRVVRALTWGRNNGPVIRSNVIFSGGATGIRMPMSRELYMKMLEEAIPGAVDDQFPHCDSLILHAPGQCQFCDRHPDWQQFRVDQGIAFSDTPGPVVRLGGLIPCPSATYRPAEVRDQWPGNVSAPAGEPIPTPFGYIIPEDAATDPSTRDVDGSDNA